MPAPKKKKSPASKAKPKAARSSGKTTSSRASGKGKSAAKRRPARAAGRAGTRSPAKRPAAARALTRASGPGISSLPPLPPPPPGAEPYPGDMARLDALAHAQGLRGLWQDDAHVHLPLESAELLALAERLEEAGRVRILSFQPLHLISNGAVAFLSGKILAYIEAFHNQHPKEAGVDLKRLSARFEVPASTLKLAIKTLVHEGRLRDEEGFLALPQFRAVLPPREEKALAELEEACFGGDFRAVSLNDVRERFNLSPDRLEAMLTRLVERRRIVQGKEGFYLHSRWLDELAARLRARPVKIMTIAEFKAMTGLSRKYAIPLLELLDEMGITRRKGSLREIL